MRIALVHYHLGPGGVSRVISCISSALSRAGVKHVILIGEKVSVGDNQQFVDDDLLVRSVPGIGYAKAGQLYDVERIIESMRLVAREALGGEVDVWHFHNHSLGKNPWMHQVVTTLARQGERLLLHLHDLAEQGRPENYSNLAGSTEIYPSGGRIRYAFINSRDLRLFINAGLAPTSAILVPNPISVSTSTRSQQADPLIPLLFAPIRAIRRKNIGELVFLSVFLRSVGRIAISRAPLDTEALAIHEIWRKFATDRRLPIAFDVVDRLSPQEGRGEDFDSWVQCSSHIITTSVSEGFGLPFLESVVWGLPLLGRGIAHIMEDQQAAGIFLDGLYDRLLVPADWVDCSMLRDHLELTLGRYFQKYGRQMKQGDLEEIYLHLNKGGWYDFGNLPEALQQKIIEQIDDCSNLQIPLVERNGTSMRLDDWLNERLTNRTVPHVNFENFAPDSISSLLKDSYHKMLSDLKSPIAFLPAERILDSFLKPEEFHFLLSVPPLGFLKKIKAVVFDVYATLLIAPAGGVKPDLEADPFIRQVIRKFGYTAPDSPSSELYRLVCESHLSSENEFPEVDLRLLWREILSLPEECEVESLVVEIERAWHPSKLMSGAAEVVKSLSCAGIPLGLLSNAQCNTVDCLGDLAPLFSSDLCILSYQYGIAKPDIRLFEMMVERLAAKGVLPEETLYIGNDPIQDIAPAAAVGFQTALFVGHPDSVRPGMCSPDIKLSSWSALRAHLSI